MATSPIPANRTVYVEQAIHVIECASCAIDFGVGVNFEKRRREDHGRFYCPNGHSNFYPQDSDVERERKRAQRLESELAAARSLASREAQRRQTAQMSARAYKGQATRLRNQVKNGVCPCCNRTFQNLANHMSTQHPDWHGS